MHLIGKCVAEYLIIVPVKTVLLWFRVFRNASDITVVPSYTSIKAQLGSQVLL